LAADLKDTLKLATPIVLVQVGHMSMGIVARDGARRHR